MKLALPVDMAGYSGTPLAKKLGIKPGMSVFVSGAPEDYLDLLEPLPEAVCFVTAVERMTDITHLFVTRREVLSQALIRLRKTLAPQATIWVSWPKKTSKVPSEITEDTIRELALPLGWVDVKVCAVNDIWSGLKLVLRKELR